MFRPKSICEEEAKFLQDRINLVEKHFAELCVTFGQYSRKTASIRDKGDEIVKVILRFSNNEHVNKSLSSGLENFADSVSLLNDYGDVRSRGLKEKIVDEFAQYEDICKHAKDDIKDIFSAREKEIQRKRQLDRIRDRNPRNRQQINQAETELTKATAELSKTLHNIEEKAATFERQKLHNLKGILLDFINIEMGYHAKALEILTQSFGIINGINEDSDLEDFQKIQGKMDMDFKKSLRLPASTSSSSIHRHGRRNSLIIRSTQSLGSIGNIFSNSHSKKMEKTSHSKNKLNKSEETLDSMKRSISESEEEEEDSSSEDEEDSEDNSSDIIKESPKVTINNNKKISKK